jgi:RHS repeat-associated protein
VGTPSVTDPNNGINPFVKKSFISIKDANSAPVKTAIKEYKCDKNGNITEVREYDWVSYGSVPRDGQGRPTDVPAGAPLKRVITSTFYNSTPDSSDTVTDSPNTYHRTTSSRVHNAVGSTEVSDATQTLSRTEIYYDNPSTTANLTEQRSWSSAKDGGARPLTRPLGQGGANNYISVSRQYDSHGNPTLSVDANGNQTKLTYGLVGSVTELYPTMTEAAFGTTIKRTSTIEYDFYTGGTTRTTDSDNNVSNSITSDAFGRPTLVVAAEGKPEETRTSTSYDDAARRVTVRSDLNTVGDGKIVTVRYYDQLGRIRLTRRLEDAASQLETDETAGIKVQTRYAYGNPSTDPYSYTLVSNPYRAATSSAAGSELTMGWNRIKVNKGGRSVEVQSFEGGSLPAPWGANSSSAGITTTSYDAEYTTVTDQAGRQRRSMTDALGRIVRVDEPDSSYNLGQTTSPAQPTSYAYDALGNLRQVSQGLQQRYFMYDSLSRLIKAKNPEQAALDGLAATDPVTGNGQWSMGYAYDGNGNLTSRTDPRGITTTYIYDALSRNTSVTYSSGESVNRYYDGSTNGKGRLWWTETVGVSAAVFDSYDSLGRPKQYHQKYWVNNNWGPQYNVGRTYNLAGNIKTENYPSGHVVTYNYDAAGRIGDNGSQAAFSGNLGDGVQRTYASQIVYDPLDGMSQERFGTDTPLYNKHFYNSRGQLAEIRLGLYPVTDPDPTRATSWQRGAIISHYGNTGWGASSGGQYNNGNPRAQDIFIPNDDGAGYEGRATNFSQAYSYDSLNRLTSVTESGGAAWAQYYKYDRWSNRTIDLDLTSGSAPKPQFELSPQTNQEVAEPSNRLYAPGDAGRLPAQKLMRYDAAGNLVFDSYTGAGARSYDAENRMTSAQDKYSGTTTYAYDADGRRIKRNIDGAETWQIYGVGGELLAEYAMNATATSPQKEYGYRGGELLVTAAVTSGWGAAPTFYENPLNPNHSGETPIRARHISELRSAIDSLRSHLMLQPYQWNALAAAGSPVSPAPIMEMRAALDQALGAPSGGYSAGLAQGQPILAVHIQELRNRLLNNWQGGAGGVDLRWMVSDQLGTPRMVVDKTGSLAGIGRHDYLPFGEEIEADGSWRNPARGYAANDNIRQKFARKERDEETSLDYFGSRYYSYTQGRFSGVDPLQASGDVIAPQSWNRYAYVSNNPLRYVDRTGLIQTDAQSSKKREQQPPPPQPPSNPPGYGDIGISAYSPTTVGATGGVYINKDGIYPYVGLGVATTPGVSINIGGSNGSVSPGQLTCQPFVGGLMMYAQGSAPASAGPQEWINNREYGGSIPIGATNLLPTAGLNDVYTFDIPVLNNLWGGLRSFSDALHESAENLPIRNVRMCVGTICGTPGNNRPPAILFTAGQYFPPDSGPVRGYNALEWMQLHLGNYDWRSNILRNAINMTITVRVPKDSPLAGALN